MLVAIPLALLAIVGLPHLLRSPLVRMVVTHEPGSEPPGVTSPLFGLAFALLTGSRLTAGHAVAVLANGDATFPGLWRDLQSARRSITVQMYYAGPGTVIDTATQILTERAHAGVAVHFLYDAFGAKDLPPRHLAALRSAGARVAEFRPLRWYALDRASHRSHVRGIIIDGAIGYTGGFGFDDKWLGAGRRPGEWRETNARFTGPAVAQLQTAFIAQWAEATGELLTGERFLPLEGAPATTAASAAGGIEAALVVVFSLRCGPVGQRYGTWDRFVQWPGRTTA